MPASPEFVERSGDLKRELVEFAQRRKYQRHLDRALLDRFGDMPPLDEPELVNFFDYFVLQYHLPKGETIVEQFVAAHPRLSEEERRMLLGWRDVVEGIFEVQGRDDDALILVNLVDELTYRARSNVGPAIFSQMPPKSFVITRLVPIEDEWLLSGVASMLPKSRRKEALEMAYELALQSPSLVFRNPEKLEQARELQRKEHREFIAFFGSDEVVIPGHELSERMRAYMHFRVFECRDDEGLTAADRAKQTYGVMPTLPESDYPDDLTEAESVGLIYDEAEGLYMLHNYGLFEETFRRPDLASDPNHRRIVLEYLKDESIPPLMFKRMAARDPEAASRVLQQVLQRPRFSWERDGEKLLRRHKASFYEREPLPSLVPVPDALAREQVERSRRRLRLPRLRH